MNQSVLGQVSSSESTFPFSTEIKDSMPFGMPDATFDVALEPAPSLMSDRSTDKLIAAGKATLPHQAPRTH
jgi:hypothetical protein